MESNFVTGSIRSEAVPTAEAAKVREVRPAIERVLEGTSTSFAEMEAHYKRRGGTLLHALTGHDPFDFWVGRFYLGAFGVVSLIGIVFGVFFYFYQVWIVEGTFNLLQARIDPPPISAGLR